MDSVDYSKKSDYFLWKLFKNGDKQALSTIYYTYFEFLYNYGLSLYNSKAFIKDCIQELFFELISKLSSLGATDNIKLYLLVSLRRKVFEKLKKQGVYNFSDVEDPVYEKESDFSPEEKIINDEEEEDIKKVLSSLMNGLPYREKEVLYLKFYQALSYKEITEIMDINYESARKLVYRALSSLRTKSKKTLKIKSKSKVSKQNY